MLVHMDQGIPEKKNVASMELSSISRELKPTDSDFLPATVFSEKGRTKTNGNGKHRRALYMYR